MNEESKNNVAIETRTRASGWRVDKPALQKRKETWLLASSRSLLRANRTFFSNYHEFIAIHYRDPYCYSFSINWCSLFLFSCLLTGHFSFKYWSAFFPYPFENISLNVHENINKRSYNKGSFNIKKIKWVTIFSNLLSQFNAFSECKKEVEKLFKN